MCFSATASFTAAGVIATVGVATLSRVRDKREVLLASFPLLFAMQQVVEGIVWLRMAETQGALQSGLLVTTFLLFAEVLWPLLVPLGVFAIEPNRRIRFILAALLAAAVAVSAYLLYAMVSAPYEVTIQGHSLRYAHDFPKLPGGKVLYAACTTLPLLLSSHRFLKVMGGLVMLGLVVSQWYFAHAFLSVWCFFAAAASIVLYLHFARGLALARITPGTGP